MGNMPSTASIHHENLPPFIRYIPLLLRQLLRFMFIHLRINNVKIFKKIQEDGFLINDDISAKHANKGVDIIRPLNNNSLSLCLPKLFH